MRYTNYLAAAFLTIGLSACGGGGDSSPSAPSSGPSSPLVGVFLDAPVAGIDYETESIKGVTNSNGEFQYRSGEGVTFRVGSVNLPPVQAAPIVTPLDMAGSQDMANQVVSNILVFLQSLDQDGNPSNGITIASNADRSASQPLNFNVPAAEFASNTQFKNLVSNAGGQNTVPVSLNAAHDHFSSTLKGRNIAVAPLANAGTAQNVVTGTTVTLNGSGSTDANGDALTYAWTLTSKPAGSNATLSGANTVNPTFVADVAGSYVASLVARDDSLNSTPATVTVSVVEKDYSNVTDYSKIGNTLISAVEIMNENMLANPIYFDNLYNYNQVVFNVPIQDYFGSYAAQDMNRATMTVTTIKADFPVQAQPDKKPYRLRYDEYDKNNNIVYTLGVGYIYGCSNANDIKNPTAECVQYYYQEIRNNAINMSGFSSINLVKTSDNGLIYFSQPIK